MLGKQINARGQLEQAVLELLSSGEELDAPTICARVRSRPHASATSIGSVCKVLARLAQLQRIHRSGRLGAYSYRRATETSTALAAPPVVPVSTPAPVPATCAQDGGCAVTQLGRYLLHPDAWRLIDRGVADQITIYLTTEPRRLSLSRREEPDLYARACCWADSLAVAPLASDERAALEARIDASEAREAEALTLAEQYAKELDEVRRELEGLKADPTKLLALLQSRLGGSS